MHLTKNCFSYNARYFADTIFATIQLFVTLQGVAHIHASSEVDSFYTILVSTQAYSAWAHPLWLGWNEYPAKAGGGG